MGGHRVHGQYHQYECTFCRANRSGRRIEGIVRVAVQQIPIGHDLIARQLTVVQRDELPSLEAELARLEKRLEEIALERGTLTRSHAQKKYSTEDYHAAVQLTERERETLKARRLERVSAPGILASIGLLRAMNVQGCDIYIRPHGSVGLVLVDDVPREALDWMAADGLKPTVTLPDLAGQVSGMGAAIVDPHPREAAHSRRAGAGATLRRRWRSRKLEQALVDAQSGLSVHPVLQRAARWLIRDERTQPALCHEEHADRPT